MLLKFNGTEAANLWLFSRQIQEVVVSKKRKVFKKVCYNVLQILAKKSLGSVLISRDSRVTANISICI